MTEAEIKAQEAAAKAAKAGDGDGDDCAKLAKAAGECTGGRRGGKDVDDANKEKDRRDRESRYNSSSYYW